MSMLVYGLLLSSFVKDSMEENASKSACRKTFKDAISSKSIFPNILEVLKPCTPYINEPLFDLKMTPLHLAAREGKADLIPPLVESGADTNSRDANRLTPLHQAAIRGHVHAVNALLKKGADGHLLSKFGGSYKDYLRMIAPFRQSTVKVDPILSQNHSYSTHNHDKLAVEPLCLSKGVKTTSENVARPTALSLLMEIPYADYASLIEEYSQNLSPILQKYSLDRYSAFKENPPALAISPVKFTDQGTAIPSEINMCGLFAQSFIPKGSIVAEYTGEMRAIKSGDDPTYIALGYPSIDSSKYRSAASMSNHGFPNACFTSLAKGNFQEGLDGLPTRQFIIATQDIKEGDEIVWDYGNQYEAIPNQIELRQQAMEQFLSTIPWKAILDGLKNYYSLELSVEKAIDHLDKVVKFLYIQNNPAALRYAIEKGFFTRKHLKLFQDAINAGDTNGLGVLKEFVKTAKSLLNQKTEL